MIHSIGSAAAVYITDEGVDRARDVVPVALLAAAGLALMGTATILPAIMTRDASPITALAAE